MIHNIKLNICHDDLIEKKNQKKNHCYYKSHKINIEQFVKSFVYQQTFIFNRVMFSLKKIWLILLSTIRLNLMNSKFHQQRFLTIELSLRNENESKQNSRKIRCRDHCQHCCVLLNENESKQNQKKIHYCDFHQHWWIQ